MFERVIISMMCVLELIGQRYIRPLIFAPRNRFPTSLWMRYASRPGSSRPAVDHVASRSEHSTWVAKRWW